jgi:hypothetical protein
MIVNPFSHTHDAALDSDSRYRLKYAFAISYDVLFYVSMPIGGFMGVNSPAYCRAGHGRDDPGSQTSEKPSPPILPSDNLGSIEQTPYIPDFSLLT